MSAVFNTVNTMINATAINYTQKKIHYTHLINCFFTKTIECFSQQTGTVNDANYQFELSLKTMSINLTEQISRRFPGHSRRDLKKNPGHVCIASACYVMDRIYYI